MTAAELTDEWIGRAVAVHLGREQPPIVGTLKAIKLVHVRTLDEDEHVTAVELTLFAPKIGCDMTGAVPPDTVITDQEVPL